MFLRFGPHFGEHSPLLNYYRAYNDLEGAETLKILRETLRSRYLHFGYLLGTVWPTIWELGVGVGWVGWWWGGIGPRGDGTRRVP